MLAAAALAMSGGCAARMQGTALNLGPVDYGLAFEAGREVMSQYFTVDSADAARGLIRSRPQGLDEPAARLVTASQARKLAVMRIARAEQDVVAQLSVVVERLDSVEFRRIVLARENYDSVPKSTPAETDAATTPEQNEVWTFLRRDSVLERNMLEDLYQRLQRRSR